MNFPDGQVATVSSAGDSITVTTFVLGFAFTYLAITLALSRMASNCISAENRLNAMIPGITMTNGMMSFKNAANTIPFCPWARDLEPNVRWVIYWLSPQ